MSIVRVKRPLQIRILVSKSLHPSELLSVSSFSVAWQIWSVASACVRPFLHFPYIFLTSHIDGVELMIIIIATFGQALAGHAHGVNIFGVLIVWRFIMGV